MDRTTSQRVYRPALLKWLLLCQSLASQFTVEVVLRESSAIRTLNGQVLGSHGEPHLNSPAQHHRLARTSLQLSGYLNLFCVSLSEGDHRAGRRLFFDLNLSLSSSSTSPQHHLPTTSRPHHHPLLSPSLIVSFSSTSSASSSPSSSLRSVPSTPFPLTVLLRSSTSAQRFRELHVLSFLYTIFCSTFRPLYSLFAHRSSSFLDLRSPFFVSAQPPLANRHVLNDLHHL
ncbi:hypothetical protein IWZ00DRAFT_28963 [Phyllosticta capitalensis]